MGVSQVPVDLVIDHSVQVDVARSENAVQANMELEFQRNKERFAFLKWGSTAFQNMLVVPPGSGIVHQVTILQCATPCFWFSVYIIFKCFQCIEMLFTFYYLHLFILMALVLCIR